jgi:hypothetical protein
MRFACKILALLWLLLAAAQPALAGNDARSGYTAAELQRQCDSGDAEACFRAANGFPVGSQDPIDNATWRAHFLDLACKGGESEGCVMLGVLYDNGKGVPKDEARAAALYEMGCNGNASLGCVFSGQRIWRVSNHPSRDELLRALAFFTKACHLHREQGCRDAKDINSELGAAAPVAAANTAPQCRTVKGTSDLGEVERTFCMENDGQWRQREARLVAAPYSPPVEAPAVAAAAPAPLIVASPAKAIRSAKYENLVRCVNVYGSLAIYSNDKEELNNVSIGASLLMLDEGVANGMAKREVIEDFKSSKDRPDLKDLWYDTHSEKFLRYKNWCDVNNIYRSGLQRELDDRNSQ